MTFLWLLPALQVLNLIFFYAVATQRSALLVTWFYNPLSLYSMALITGLMGGAVYVHGYQRILKDVPTEYVEFSVGAVSMAEGLGILVADVSSLFLQACLYQINDITGALVHCPLGS